MFACLDKGYGLPGPEAQSVVSLIADPEVMSLIPARLFFWSISHEIFSMFIFLLLIQEGLLSVTSGSM